MPGPANWTVIRLNVLLIVVLITAKSGSSTSTMTPGLTSPGSRSGHGRPSVTELKVGVIIISGHGAPYDVQRTGAAIQMAFDEVNTALLNDSYRLVKIERHYGPRCDAETAPGIAAEMFYNDDIIALIGPGCTHALDPVGRLAAYWNIPIITGLGDSGIFKDKSDFKTLTRMAYCQCRLRKVFGAVFTTFNWTNIAIVIDRNDLHASILGDTLDVGLQKANIFPNVHRFFSQQHPDKAKILQKAAENARIIVLSVAGADVRSFMLTAHALGFTNGDFVFMDVELFRFKGGYWGDHHWRRGDLLDDTAKLAYNALLRVALHQPNSSNFKTFSDEVKRKALQIYGFDYADEQVNFFVGAFFDGVMHYGKHLNRTLERGFDYRDGYNLTRRMWDQSFVGITDEVFIDNNGDRDTSYAIMDMNPDSGEFEPVAYYWGDRPGYTPVSGRVIYWAQGKTAPPPNVPFCGFKNENPLCKSPEPMSPVLITMIAILCVVVVGGGIAFLVYRKYKLEAELRDMSWLVQSNDVQHRKTTFMSSMAAMSIVSNKSNEFSADGESGGMGQTGGNQVYTDVAVYKGQSVAVRQLRKKNLVIRRDLLMEVKLRRNLIHDNIVKFVGAVIEPPKLLLLHEYCPKGSLQDLLANDSINLDSVFKMSLIEDIVKGMQYIHNSAVSVHGRLCSSNCVVDSRFILKLTDFGLPRFFEDEDATEAENEYSYYTKLLWRAPEYLRSPSQVKGSARADVYSFGIILEEIIVRGGPYDAARIILEPKEIVEKVRAGGKEPFRPEVAEGSCVPALHQLMIACLAEEPASRPDFGAIKVSCRRISGGRETNLLDNLLNRMEQYAHNLEGLVADRTSLLAQEQKKTEQLLLQILPRSIMEQLKAGRSVDPEWFDEVSIYFSDICGFTNISAASTPIQVVTMLNDLYTAFDSTIEKFDVYKVETIGDAYMVASGLPERNGTLHAREIARMSMALLSSISKFRMRHLPEETLKLRIGLHTGPVCAGVVGLKMPRYCLFGDTVNTASRMESNGLPLRIHISEVTHRLLTGHGSFCMEERGQIEVKGKGSMMTYWLNGED